MSRKHNGEPYPPQYAEDFRRKKKGSMMTKRFILPLCVAAAVCVAIFAANAKPAQNANFIETEDENIQNAIAIETDDELLAELGLGTREENQKKLNETMQTAHDPLKLLQRMGVDAIFPTFCASIRVGESEGLSATEAMENLMTSLIDREATYWHGLGMGYTATAAETEDVPRILSGELDPDPSVTVRFPVYD